MRNNDVSLYCVCTGCYINVLCMLSLQATHRETVNQTEVTASTATELVTETTVNSGAGVTSKQTVQREQTVTASTETLVTREKSAMAKYSDMDEEQLNYHESSTSSSSAPSSTPSQKEERAAKAEAGTLLSGMIGRMPQPPGGNDPPIQDVAPADIDSTATPPPKVRLYNLQINSVCMSFNFWSCHCASARH